MDKKMERGNEERRGFLGDSAMKKVLKAEAVSFPT